MKKLYLVFSIFSKVNPQSVSTHDYTYDLVVIGGGSGGLAASKEAASLGKKVAVMDFVKPSPMGTTWGLGGTCVNVGCIPKKLMHNAGIIGEQIKDAPKFGWEIKPEEVKHNWQTMVQNIQDYIGGLNWGYKVELRDKNVKYINSYGVIQDPHTIKATNKRGKEEMITTDKILGKFSYKKSIASNWNQLFTEKQIYKNLKSCNWRATKIARNPWCRTLHLIR